MAAAAFTKFDPSAFLKSEVRGGTPAKPAKVAKAPLEQEAKRNSILASLAALAGGLAKTQNIEPAPGAWAEGFTRLDPNKPPSDVAPKRWLRFVDDCSRFLDGGWAARAAALGWESLELFGCDRQRPFARLDNMGLLWFVNGGTILALTADGAVIETRMGARQSYRRRSLDMSRVVLVWEVTD